MMFASVSRTCSNPATVAAMIRVNGLDAVRRGGMVAPKVLLDVCRAARRGEFDDYRKMLAGRRISPDFIAMMTFARRHGPESLDSTERRPHGARLVSALQDVWHERIDTGETGRRHGWDVGRALDGLTRGEIYERALRIGIDLDAVSLPVEANPRPGGVMWKIRASARVMRRACLLFGVTPEELRSDTRHTDLTIPRFFYAHWAKRMAGMSYPEIGRKLGGRDHTTAMNADRKWPAKRDKARALIEARRLTCGAGRRGGGV
jgi:hypothetical protein